MADLNLMGILPHKYPFLFVDKLLLVEEKKRIVGIKNVSINEPYFPGHYPDNPIMPGSLILESLIQTGSCLLLKDTEFSGRYPSFLAVNNVVFSRKVVPGDQLRLECEITKIEETAITMTGVALVDGCVVCEGALTFSLSRKLSRPQIHPTASVHPSAVLGKDVSVGPFSLIGENVIIGDRTILEAHVMVEKWTKIGEDCHIHYGTVLGSPPQDASYKGEKTWVVMGDRNEIREYVTINRSSGKNTVTEIGSDNLFLTNVHIGHNSTVGNHVVIANGTNAAGHTMIEDNVNIGGMTGIHQFVRIGKGSMVGAYTRLPQDVPPFMLCEGNPALIRTINSIGLRRNRVSKETIQEIKNIYKLLYRSEKNTSQALGDVVQLNPSSDSAIHLIEFLRKDSSRGITKKSATP